MNTQESECSSKHQIKIYSTENFDLFKVIDKNRRLVKNHLNRVKKSLMEFNLLSINPIIVNSNFEVIDGQHRLEACRQLGLRVYYFIYEGDATNALVVLNRAQTSWKMGDYYNFYKDHPKLAFLRGHQEKWPFPLNTILRLLLKDQSKGTTGEIFKNLQLRVSSVECARFLDYWGSLVRDGCFLSRQYYFLVNTTFGKALFNICYNTKANWEDLKKRIWGNADIAASARGQKNVQEALIRIYNHRKSLKNRIKLFPLEERI